ncbi:MAG TPA: hypothetical protein VFR75_10300, partial [Solirubrobacterales bacterium]|nr:hypothetical protein [Solirubrobacterales bacterium]
MVESVADQVVQYLRQLRRVAGKVWVSRFPFEAQDAVFTGRARRPSFYRRFDDLPQGRNLIRRRFRSTVDLTIKPVDRRGGHLQRRLEGPPPLGGDGRRESDGLERPAQLVHRLVQGGAPPALAQGRNPA